MRIIRSDGESKTCIFSKKNRSCMIINNILSLIEISSCSRFYRKIRVDLITIDLLIKRSIRNETSEI